MKIPVEFQPLGRKIEVPEGVTILEAAQSAGVGLLATCGGQSSCGSCVIRLVSGGSPSEPGPIEKEHLSETEIAEGYRLACQTRISAASVIEIPSQSLSTPQRLQVEGESSISDFCPRIRIIDLILESQNPKNEQDIKHIITTGLAEQGLAEIRPESELCRKATLIAAENQGRVRLVISSPDIISALPPETHVLGLAVDIGTTKIAAYLVDLESGITLSKQGCMNPQTSYGDDVMARITFALSSESGIDKLQASVVQAINQLTADLCLVAQEESENTQVIPLYHPSLIAEAVMVGNTAMHHIFLGLPLQNLGHAPYEPAESDAIDLPASQLNIKISPEAFIHLLPNVAGFVGADHVSMLLAAGIIEEHQNTLYIDIGTNTEITLLMDGRMICCSTASGPAFEGAHIKDGMRAAEGAIEKIRIKDNSIQYQTINNAMPVGICGSGIIDVIAQMLENGIMNKRGMMNLNHPLVRKGEKGSELLIVPAEKTGHKTDIVISRKDISEIQLSKGAIQAGLELLLYETGSLNKIEQVIIAGAFGSFIDIRSAKTIGLFPNLDITRFKQVGNAAGMGARQSLLSLTARNQSTDIAKKLEYLELATHPGFTDAFTKAMIFDPGPEL